MIILFQQQISLVLFKKYFLKIYKIFALWYQSKLHTTIPLQSLITCFGAASANAIITANAMRHLTTFLVKLTIGTISNSVVFFEIEQLFVTKQIQCQLQHTLPWVYPQWNLYLYRFVIRRQLYNLINFVHRKNQLTEKKQVKVEN